MAFTLYSLLQAALLCVNAIAVLHEERFLKNSEWDRAAGLRGWRRSPGVAEQRWAAGGETLGRDRREPEGSTLGGLSLEGGIRATSVSPSLSSTAGRRLTDVACVRDPGSWDGKGYREEPGTPLTAVSVA